MRLGSTLALVPLWIGIVLAPNSARAGGWALPDESRGHRVAPLLLLSRPDVRDDLRIPAAMADEIDRAIDDLHRKAAALKGKSGEAALEGRRAVDEGEKLWLESHLAPDQVDRLSQLDLRWEGPAALATRPSVAEALSLSGEQRAALARAVADRKVHPEKAREAEDRLAALAISALSDGQKSRWVQMLGRPFIPHAVASAAHSPGP